MPICNIQTHIFLNQFDTFFYLRCWTCLILYETRIFVEKKRFDMLSCTRALRLLVSDIKIVEFQPFCFVTVVSSFTEQYRFVLSIVVLSLHRSLFESHRKCKLRLNVIARAINTNPEEVTIQMNLIQPTLIRLVASNAQTTVYWKSSAPNPRSPLRCPVFLNI